MSFAIDQVVNEDTKWEYSLSVPIRQLINNNLFTAANIEEYVFSGLTDNRVSYIANVEDPDTIDTQTKNRTYNGKYNQTSFINWSENVPNEISHVNGSELSAFTFYQRNVLVAPATPGSTALGLDSLRLVLDIKDIKNWLMDFDTNPVHSQVTLTSANGQTGNGYSGSAYHWGSSASVGPTITTRQTTGSEIIKGLHVATITIINDELWFGYLNPSNNHNEFYQNQGFSRRLYNIYGHSSQTNQYRSGKRGMWTQSAAKYSMYPSWNSPVFPPSSDIGSSSIDKLFYNAGGNGVIIDCAYKYNDPADGVAATSVSTSSGYLARDYNTLLTWLSWCGLYFRIDGITYKPIISGGVITGYTSDMSKVSDFDNMTNVTGNNVPVTPPSPSGTDEDNTDPIPVVAAPYSSGLARYYVTTVASPILGHISEAMGAWNIKDSGKDLYRNIISCKLIKSPAPIPVSGSEPFTVYGVTLQYQGADITLPVINDNPTASFGSYSIPRKFDDFRDYAPYTKVEIYLPYCGWTVLPSHVVGRSVSVKYYTDIIAGTCKAIVYCESNVIAEAAGVIGLDIPMITENAGAKAEAVTMGLLAYGKAGLQTALGIGAAVATKGKAGVKSAVGGLENLVSAYSQTAMAFNQNYTEINGKNGDGCCIAGISAIVIKITRPKYGANTTAPYVPSEYGHSTGFVSMKSATVGSFTGLLVADNVDTSGISGATEREKQLIKLYLESGIYVNHPN